MRTFPIALVVLALLVSACRPKPAVSDAPDRSDEVAAEKADPPAGAREIGPVEAMDGGGCGMLGVTGTYAGALRAVKNKAVAMGATYVKIVALVEPHETAGCWDKGYTIRGVAYQLNATPAASASASAPAPTCDPPCSPGYACEGTTCKPLCNPACGAGQVCGANRTCEPLATKP